MSNITHNDLIEAGRRWLSDKCGFVACEMKSQNKEIPDVIGFNSSGSFVLEAKISRGDFFADNKKIFRQIPSLGMGDWRFYITPPRLVSIDELPAGWGLIEYSKGRRARVVFCPFGRGNIYSTWGRVPKNTHAEINLMYSALRRANRK